MDGPAPLSPGEAAMRLPPANIEAEQGLLGGILANNAVYDRAAGQLRPEHFVDEVHGRIFAAIVRRIESGQVADAVSLAREADAAEALAEVGGRAYLARLLALHVPPILAAGYAREIHDCWMRREIIARASAAIELAYGAEPELDAAAVRDRADAALAQLAQEGVAGATEASGPVAQRAVQQMVDAIQRGGGLAGISTGLAGLDRMTGGLRPGQLVVIGARASMGKTALGARIALGAAEAGARVLFVTIEMTSESVMARMLAGRMGVPLSVVLRGLAEEPDGTPRPLRLEDWQVPKAGAQARAIQGLPLEWMYHGAPTTSMVRGHARGLKRRQGLDLVVVDYLGLLRPSVPLRDGNRVQEIGLITRELKAMAVDLGVPVLALSQLSRKVEDRDDQRPRLSDLRDSGEIEQHADVVGLLYREHYYLTRAKPARKPREKAEDFEARMDEWWARLARTQGRAELDIAKQRQGATGPVRLRFHDASAWFADETDPETQETGI